MEPGIRVTNLRNEVISPTNRRPIFEKANVSNGGRDGVERSDGQLEELRANG
jgi:hypothetical protein